MESDPNFGGDPGCSMLLTPDGKFRELVGTLEGCGGIGVGHLRCVNSGTSATDHHKFQTFLFDDTHFGRAVKIVDTGHF